MLVHAQDSVVIPLPMETMYFVIHSASAHTAVFKTSVLLCLSTVRLTTYIVKTMEQASRKHVSIDSGVFILGSLVSCQLSSLK